MIIIKEITNADIMVSLESIQGKINSQNEKIEGIVNNIAIYNNLTEHRCLEITANNSDTHKELWDSIKELKETTNKMIGGFLVISVIWSIPVLYLINRFAGM